MRSDAKRTSRTSALLQLLLRKVKRFSLGGKGILVCEDTGDACCDLVVNNRLVVLANDIDAELLFGVKFTLHEHNKK